MIFEVDFDDALEAIAFKQLCPQGSTTSILNPETSQVSLRVTVENSDEFEAIKLKFERFLEETLKRVREFK